MRLPAITTVVTLQALALICTTGSKSPPAQADTLAYLINVTVRPGYGFANADDAVTYGRGVCDKIGAGRTYADIIGSVKTDSHNPDDYQASYLIAQAVNELCPALIWQLRNSAAHYKPPPP